MSDVCLAELDFENTQLKCENTMLKLDGTLLMLDKAFSMYDYATKYGVDRAFVRMHNTHSELDALAGMIYPSNESFDGFDVDLAKYKQVCMEGILEAITNAVKWVIEKLKALCSWISEMFDKFVDLFRNKSKNNKKEIKALRAVRMSDDEFDVEVVSTKAVAKYKEILQKIEAESNNDAFVPGADEHTQLQLLEYLKTFTTKNKNEHIEKITIKDTSGKDRVLNIADRTTQDFENLITAIGRTIAFNKQKIASYEKREQELTKRLADNNNGDVKTKLASFKSSIKKYKTTVSVLSKLLKLMLDDTNITAGMLNSIKKHIAGADKQAANVFNQSQTLPKT